MTCNCIKAIDKMLSEQNTRIMLPIMLGQDQTQRPMIVTEQIKTGRGKTKACGLLAKYCPFCGTDLVHQEFAIDWPDAPLPDQQLANGGACS